MRGRDRGESPVRKRDKTPGASLMPCGRSEVLFQPQSFTFPSTEYLYSHTTIISWDYPLYIFRCFFFSHEKEKETFSPFLSQSTIPVNISLVANFQMKQEYNPKLLSDYSWFTVAFSSDGAGVSPFPRFGVPCFLILDTHTRRTHCLRQSSEA